MIGIVENELYQEIELFDGNIKIGEAEVDIKNKMLSRLSIFPPYQNKGYGTEIVKQLTEKYDLNILWVNADNDRAIHTYEKNGYKIKKPTMYLMEKEEKVSKPTITLKNTITVSTIGKICMVEWNDKGDKNK